MPPPLEEGSDVDSHNVSDIDNGEEVQQGSDDEGEDLMANMEGSVS